VPGFECREKEDIFSPKCPYQFRGSPSLLLNVYWGLFPGLKRQGPEVNDTPSSSAEVKNEWSYTSIPPVCLCDLDDETFAFIKIITIKST
jgi:hypothetical protein